MPYKDKDQYKEYQRVYQANWRKENPESTKKTKKTSSSKSYIKHKDKIESQRMSKRYGITSEEYQILFDEQKGCCSVCGRHQSEFKRALSVDHDHETGKIRSLLCPNCNIALGHAKDDVNILQKLIDYLRRHND